MNQKQPATERQNANRSAVVIAAQSGRMRDSLRLLLGTAPEVEVVGTADDSASALRQVADNCPALLLLDANLPGEDTITVLRRIRDRGRQPQCLVLVDTQSQQRDALAAGADGALIKGYSTGKLFEAIRELIGKQETFAEQV